MEQEEIIKLSDSELQEKLGSFKKAYADLKMNHAITPLENPIQIRQKRKVIARVFTEINKRKITKS